MDSYEAKLVFSRIQSLEPENASKIMGYLLLQDHFDKEMIRLAFGPDTLLHNLILQAKTHLASRITNGFDLTITTPPSPSPNSWPPLLSPTKSVTTSSEISYGNVINGNISNNACNYSNDLVVDEYQLQDHFPFLNDSNNDDLFDPRLDLAVSRTACGDNNNNNNTLLHRRGFSVPGLCYGAEDANCGVGWKPCLYFARGFCKNGNTCRFLHGDQSADFAAADANIVGSPISKVNESEQCQELLRSKFVAGASSPYSRCLNFLLQQQNETQRSAAAAAMMMGDELHKLGRCRPERNDFSPMGLGGMMNVPGSSRQIYLTFPADSIFREEDVSNYFSIYGPVQDVRIPYQQKRMFGFVTFVYPETVKLILAKGNPHFVCDSRVLVKPYKEKGKILDKKQHHQKQQQMERGEYSACLSPSALDSREPFDIHLGARMFLNTQDMLLRKKLEEQDDLQQALELHGRRLMNLKLLDFKNHSRNHQYLHGLSNGSPIPSPALSRSPNNNRTNLIFPVDGIDQELPEGYGTNSDAPVSLNAIEDADQEVNPASDHNNGNDNNSSKVEKSNTEESELHESLEHILPDNLFNSPKNSAGDHYSTVFSSTSIEVDDDSIGTPTSTSNTNPLMSTTSGLNITTPPKSCFLQMPRFSSGNGAIGM